MKKHTLIAQKRDLLGRKVKQLRASGQIPASVYGKKVASAALALNAKDFFKVHGEAGETGLIELTVEGTVRPVLIHGVQVHPLTGSPLHVEFYQVDLKEKVHTKVPLEFVNESPAVTQKLGVLLSVLDELEVEALPTDLPEKLLVDVSPLEAVDQEVKVKDVKAPNAVTVLTDPELTIVKVGPLVTKEAAAEAVAAEEAAKAVAVEAAQADGEEPKSSEVPAKAAPAPEEAPKEK